MSTTTATTVTVGINSFVTRQTAASPFSHFNGNLDQVVQLAQDNFAFANPGYMDGVVLVPVPAKGFFSGVVALTPDSAISAIFAARREGEDPYLQICAKGDKVPARKVELVLYRHDVLAKDGDAETECEWELISINARPTLGPEPITPPALVRNLRHRAGGSDMLKGRRLEDLAAAELVDLVNDLADSVEYWSTHALVAQ